MSHVVSIQTRVRDAAAAASACRRLGLSAPVAGTTELYSGPVSGLAVQLPGWLYPAVADLATGEVKFDNYGGAWGDQKELDRFLQAYAVEKARAEALRRGLTVTEEALADGSIHLEIFGRGV